MDLAQVCLNNNSHYFTFNYPIQLIFLNSILERSTLSSPFCSDVYNKTWPQWKVGPHSFSTSQAISMLKIYYGINLSSEIRRNERNVDERLSSPRRKQSPSPTRRSPARRISQSQADWSLPPNRRRWYSNLTYRSPSSRRRSGYRSSRDRRSRSSRSRGSRSTRRRESRSSERRSQSSRHRSSGSTMRSPPARRRISQADWSLPPDRRRRSAHLTWRSPSPSPYHNQQGAEDVTE